MTLEPGLDADLVKRLRFAWEYDTPQPGLCDEAADRIEFLFGAFAQCTRNLRDNHETIASQQDDIDGLLGSVTKCEANIDKLEAALLEISTKDCTNCASSHIASQILEEKR